MSHRDVEVERMEAHPGIVFRDGASGRRAALASGPDVWEIIAALESNDLHGEEGIAELAALINLTPAQIHVAIRYYGAFPEEIDERVRRHLDEADSDEAAWRLAMFLHERGLLGQTGLTEAVERLKRADRSERLADDIHAFAEAEAYEVDPLRSHMRAD